jgi:hypothetical protein
VLLAAVIGTAALSFAASAVLWPGQAGAEGLDAVDLAFWTVVCLVASAVPVRTPRGSVVSVSFAPIIAVAALGGPVAAGFVALVGTTELRELRQQVPWYGSLYNHAVTVIPAILAGVVVGVVTPRGFAGAPLDSLLAVCLAGGAYFLVNEFLTAAAVSLRDDRRFGGLIVASLKSFGLSIVGLAPMAWLMAEAYVDVGPASVLIFALPLYTTRAAYASVMEIRDMFTQTVRALASAIDARDPSTKKHSEHVSTIAVDLGRVLGCSESELEQLEWGGLLHDIGKIGVRDAVLLKPSGLDPAERLLMNEHPVKGEEILKGVKKLSPELPLIRHHHEWFDGSGYPDGLAGEQIPFLARILHVADSFEAMTASRPYRVVPLSREQALGELRKFSGIQFDPRVVEAFMKTEWATGRRILEPVVPDKGIPSLGQVAAFRAKGSVSQTHRTA